MRRRTIVSRGTPKIKSQIEIFHFFHEAFLMLSFVIVAAQVQQSMKHNSMKFFFNGYLKAFCVFLYSIDADINIGKDFLWRGGKIESDHVRIEIMTQIFAIYSQENLVAAKNIIQVVKLPFFLDDQGIDKTL